MRRTQPRNRQRFAAQVTVIFALSLVLLLGFVALAIDGGYYLSQRRAVQNAADAAAMAAGRFLSQSKQPGSALAQSGAASMAQSYATLNGFQNGTGGNVVSVASSATQVTVTITHPVPQFFIGVVYSGAWQVGATATARLSSEPGPYALIALGTSPSPGITLGGLSGNGTSHITIECDPPADGCGSIGSNSNITYNGNVTGTVGGDVGAVGTISNVPNSFQANSFFTDQGIIGDPFLPITSPPGNPSACGVTPPSPEISDDGSTATIGSGHWGGDGGGNLNLPGKVKNIVLEAGVYCFDTNFPPVSNIQNIDASAGVLLYFRNGAVFAPPNSASFTVNDAIDTGHDWGDPKWNKIAIWVDVPKNADGSCSTISGLDLHGNGDMTINGAIYAPCSSVVLGGTSGTKTMSGIVIGNDISLSGNMSFSLTTDTNYKAGPGQVFLVK